MSVKSERMIYGWEYTHDIDSFSREANRAHEVPNSQKFEVLRARTYEKKHAIIGGETGNDDAERAGEPTGDSESERQAQNAGPDDRNDDVR